MHSPLSGHRGLGLRCVVIKDQPWFFSGTVGPGVKSQSGSRNNGIWGSQSVCGHVSRYGKKLWRTKRMYFKERTKEGGTEGGRRERQRQRVRETERRKENVFVGERPSYLCSGRSLVFIIFKSPPVFPPFLQFIFHHSHSLCKAVYFFLFPKLGWVQFLLLAVNTFLPKICLIFMLQKFRTSNYVTFHTGKWWS